MSVFHFRHRWSYSPSGSAFSETFRVCEVCERTERATYDFISPGWELVASPKEGADGK